MKILFAESGISLTIECGIQIPLKDTVQESEIQYLESEILVMDSRTKDCLGLSYKGRNNNHIYALEQMFKGLFT